MEEDAKSNYRNKKAKKYKMQEDFDEKQKKVRITIAGLQKKIRSLKNSESAAKPDTPEKIRGLQRRIRDLEETLKDGKADLEALDKVILEADKTAKEMTQRAKDEVRNELCPPFHHIHKLTPFRSS